MSRLYMIRHGQASFGKENYDKLSDTGMEQSEILARYLQGLGISFDLIISGSLVRHKETAAPYLELAGRAGDLLEWVEFDEYRTREVFATLVPILLEEQPDMRPHVEFIFKKDGSFLAVLNAVMDMWRSGKYDREGMESWMAFLDRVNRGIDRVIREAGSGKSIAVFTSGGPVSVAMRRALALKDEKAMRLRNVIVNTSVTTFKYRGDEFTLTGFNGYPHLELEKRKELITYR